MCILEFTVKASDLETPVWNNSDSYFGQGSNPQPFRDADEQKNTYPGLLGVDGAKEQLQIALTAASQNQKNLEKLTGKSFAGYDDFLAYFK